MRCRVVLDSCARHVVEIDVEDLEQLHAMRPSLIAISGVDVERIAAEWRLVSIEEAS